MGDLRPLISFLLWKSLGGMVSALSGTAARKAHVAASVVRADLLVIPDATYTKAESIQRWLEDTYAEVDYGAALDAALELGANDFEDFEEHTYGEFDLPFFLALLEELNPPPTASFLDLGSGRGQLVMAAAEVREWTHCRGVELMPELHCIACAANSAASSVTPRAPCDVTGVPEPRAPCVFECGNMYDVMIPKNSVIFVYATCLPVDENGELDELTRSLEGQLRDASSSCQVITINRPLKVGHGFELVKTVRGPNPETSDGLLSTAFIWSNNHKGGLS